LVEGNVDFAPAREERDDKGGQNVGVPSKRAGTKGIFAVDDALFGNPYFELFARRSRLAPVGRLRDR